MEEEGVLNRYTPPLAAAALLGALVPGVGVPLAVGSMLVGFAIGHGIKRISSSSQEKNKLEVLPPERTDDYPTTVAARRSPYEVASFLKYKAEEETYRYSLVSSSSIAKNLLDSLPEGALDNSKGLNVRISRRSTGLVSFLSSENERINIEIKVK
ncbi:MAG: hypothetical protein QXX68_01220 [Candidatus Pacearchaeota archaeon]